MVSSGAFAKPSLCLRFQLREIIFRDLRRLRVDARRVAHLQLSRSVHTTDPRCQQQDALSPIQDPEQPTNETEPKIRKVGARNWQGRGPSGRIVGKPGRRQRVDSERLKTSFLDKSSSVIVLRDVKEAQAISSSTSDQAVIERRSLGSRKDGLLAQSITAEQIEGYIAEKDLAPRNEEIKQTIDELKPASGIMDAREFESLVQKLMKGFTRRQLTRYMGKHQIPEASDFSGVAESPSDDKNVYPASSHWQPGQTPIVQRHYHIPGKGPVNSKAYAVDQLLRDVWKITVSSEEQEIGELETVLQPWQLSLLLDVTYNGMPCYQSLLNSDLLINASHVQAHRPANVLRITARRQDAAEILQRITLALSSIHHFDFDITEFAPLKAAEAKMHDKFKLAYRQDDLDFISNSTRSLVKPLNNECLRIYSFSESDRDTARNMLLETLNVVPYRSIDRTWKDRVTGDVMSVPVTLSGSLPRRYQGTDFRRSVQTELHPEKKSQMTSAFAAASRTGLSWSGDMHGHATAIATQLDSMTPRVSIPGIKSRQRGDSITLSEWKADFCHVIRSSSLPSESSVARGTSLTNRELIIAHPQTPGFQSLARYLEPIGEERRACQIVVQLIPMPNASEFHDVTPRMILTFQELGSGGNFELTRYTAVLDEQSLKVPLPSQTVDVQFKRQLYVDLVSKDRIRDGHVNHLADMLRENSRKGRPLMTGHAETLLQLPEWLVNPGKETHDLRVGHKLVAIPYLLEQCKIVQIQQLRPSSTSTHHDVVQLIPENVVLEYREVDGGVVGSSHSSLSLISCKRPPLLNEATTGHDVVREAAGEAEAKVSQEVVQSEADLSTSTSSLEMVNVTLRVASLLTRARMGCLSATTYHESTHDEASV